MLWMYQRVFYGNVKNPVNTSLPDLDLRERGAVCAGDRNAVRAGNRNAVRAGNGDAISTGNGDAGVRRAREEQADEYERRQLSRPVQKFSAHHEIAE